MVSTGTPFFESDQCWNSLETELVWNDSVVINIYFSETDLFSLFGCELLYDWTEYSVLIVPLLYCQYHTITIFMRKKTRKESKFQLSSNELLFPCSITTVNLEKNFVDWVDFT